MKTPSTRRKQKTMQRNRHAVLGTHIDALSWQDALRTIRVWAEAHESRYVCLCNVHSVVTTSQDPVFRQAIEGADMAAPDGAPIAWTLRRSGYKNQDRISGPDLMWRYLGEARRARQRVFLYGSTEATLVRLRAAIARHFPGLSIAGAWSPPFRSLSPAEEQAEIAMINQSGAHVVLVGLGCPKQEKWMAAHRGQIHAVMIGVGAAFDFHAGVVRRAPPWMQRYALEWLHRLCADPRRLLKRYLVTNTLFVMGMAKQFVSRKKTPP